MDGGKKGKALCNAEQTNVGGRFLAALYLHLHPAQGQYSVC